MNKLDDVGNFLELNALEEDFFNLEALKEELQSIQEALSQCTLHPDCPSAYLQSAGCFQMRCRRPRRTSRFINEAGEFNLASAPAPAAIEPVHADNTTIVLAENDWPYLKDTIKRDQQISHYNKNKSNISVVFVGDVHCGKSTTMGHLIYKLGGIDEGIIDSLEEAAVEINRSSFKYAWVVDKLKAEREDGTTMGIAVHRLETFNHQCSFIDAPGRRQFFNSMHTGISLADVVILVIDSSTTISGMTADAYESAFIAFALGAEQIICCCNKMDATEPKFSELRYKEIMKGVRPQLKKMGYKKISAVPISGFEGDNLTERSPNLKWHKGCTLLEAIDNIKEPMRLSHLPLRLPLVKSYKKEGVGTVVFGRVATGVVKDGMQVMIGGLNSKITVHTLNKAVCEPGKCIAFLFKDISLESLRPGSVASSTESPAIEATSFTAKVFVLHEFKSGDTPIVHGHIVSFAANVSKILSKIDGESDKVLEVEPELLNNGDAGFVKIIPTKPVVVETFSEYAPLGRFVLRNLGKMVAYGFIQSIKDS